MHLLICNEFGRKLADVIERTRPVVRHDHGHLPDQARFQYIGIPTEREPYRRWARTRFGSAGVASAVHIDRAAGHLPPNTLGPHPFLEKIAGLRTALRRHAPASAATEAEPVSGEIQRFDNSTLAISLGKDTAPIALVHPNDALLTEVTDTLTFNKAVWGRRVLWLAIPSASATHSRCWQEALAGFSEVSFLVSSGDAAADAALLLSQVGVSNESQEH